MHFKRITAILLTMFLSIAMFGMLPLSFAQSPQIRFIASVSEFGNPTTRPDVVGTTFDVAVVIEDTADLYGMDFQMNWSTQWIAYTGYTVTIPYDSFMGVQPPSPYAGILNAPTMELKKAVDEGGVLGGEPGSMAWFSYSSMSPATGFDANGTVVVFSFILHDQPYMPPSPDTTVKFHFVQTSLSDSAAQPITHTAIDLDIPLYAREFTYPPRPMLKLTPETYAAGADCVCKNFTMDVMLMDETGADLSSFWDVAGADFYVNFNSTLIEAVDIEIDPDGDFGVFWDSGTFELINEINNPEGWAHVAFMGLGAHSAVFGTIRVATITFHMIYEHVGYPPPTSPITLKNPLNGGVGWFILDALGGIIDLSAPIGEEFFTLFPNAAHGIEYTCNSWTDEDGDGELSVGDQIILDNLGTGKEHDYYVDSLYATLNLTQLPFPALDDYVWAASFGPDNLADNGLPGRYVGTDDPYNGFGVPDWTGNFSLTYPFASVNQINVTHFPFTPDEYTVTLTAGVDYLVHAGDDKVELLVPQDDYVWGEYWVDGVNNTLNGWPWINYIASGISHVTVDFMNGTVRPATNLGCYAGPPSEWWFDPDWTWELEGWWALGYYCPAPYCWPAGSGWWVDYTAASYLTIDYNAEPDPLPYYMEYDYDAFMALGDPVCTYWDEVYPDITQTWHIFDWIDSDTSGDITYCDFLSMEETAGLIRDYHVEGVSLDIKVIQKPCVQDIDDTQPYYTDPVIVDIAAFPHPERDMSPWFGRDYSHPLPNAVEDAEYTACYKVLGRQIDLFVCPDLYPPPFNGEGPNNPADLFWPQKEVCLCAKVTYNLWPEQQKDVAFQIIDPWGDTYAILCNRTNEDGLAKICFRLPWMCDDPEYYFGEWTVIATVDIACIVVNDTMNFKYDYLIHITEVTVDPLSVAHYEYVTVTVTYCSAAMQYYNMCIAVAGLDETGVPFDYGYVWVTIGGAEYCTYECGQIQLELYVPKWARAGKATIHVNALDGFPILGGYQHYPLVTVDFTITAEP